MLDNLTSNIIKFSEPREHGADATERSDTVCMCAASHEVRAEPY